MLKSASLIVSVLCAFSLATPAIAQTAPTSGSVTLRYVFLKNGERGGSEVDTYTGATGVDSTFEFNDRGRGPNVVAHYILAASGQPTRTDITGVDYLKAPVDEHFSFNAGTSRWKSTSEEGSVQHNGFYLSNNGPSSETGFLVKALKAAGSGGVPLLPSGIAHLERLAEATVGKAGLTLHVTEYGITGLSLTPVTVWVDDQSRFFANPGNWSALIREGYEDANQQLTDLQDKAESDRFARLAHDLTQHPTQPIAFTHVRVFDSVQAIDRPDQTVVITGDRIVSVGPTSTAQIPGNARRIDGTGKTLLPGLFDMHVHVQALDGILNIASGVTTVRDMGNGIDDLRKLQQQWESGTAIGPRLWKAGLIDGRDPMQAPTGIYVSTQEEANAAVNRYADLGYIQTKMYSSLPTAFVPEMIKISHDRGMRVSGHIPNGMTAAEFVREGADEVQHINFIFLNFFADKVKDTRTPERFTSVGQYAAGLDLESQPVKDFIALLLQHHTTVDVTLATFEGMYTGRPREVSPDFAPVLARLPAQVQRSAYSGGLPVTPQNDQLYKDSYAAMLKMTKRLYDAGVPILAGTDATAGLMLHRELELEVKAGIPPNKALQNATYLAATVLKQTADLGSIEPGKRADLLLVEGDPAVTISDIRRCRITVKNGNLFDDAKLYEAIGIQPAP